MAGDRSARRSSRAKRARDEDSDDPEMSAAVQLTRLDSTNDGVSRESDRLAKIQEKNRKAQQKFRERRKEKMLTMEREIQELNEAVRQLRAEKDQLQEQLAIEKRVNSENSAKLEQKPDTLGTHGLHDYDPIDMSFLPQWEGLSLSNEKIRAMPADTLKILIQTILQHLRTRLANTDASMSPSVGQSVTQAFNFLNRCYMVEPVRYRKVVVEMMGSGGLASPASSSDTKPHILLTRDQELAISNAVETFEKKCEELRGQREGICEAVKQYRVGRGSELENMRAFIQVHAHLESLQDSLRAENEVLVRFMMDAGRVLGPVPLTQAMFASGGQDIFTYCQAIHCRSLMVNSASLGSQPVAMVSGGHGSTLPHGALPSGSWLSIRDGANSIPITGSIPLVDNFMISRMNDSAPIEMDQQMRDRAASGLSEIHRRTSQVADATMQQGGGASRSSPPAPQHQSITHESPFLYGPGERNGQQPNAALDVVGGYGHARSDGPPTQSTAAAELLPKVEPGTAGPAAPMGSGSDLMELMRSFGERRHDSMQLSAGLRTLLKENPMGGSLGLQPDSNALTPFITAGEGASEKAAASGADVPALRTPTAELLAGSLAHLQSNPTPTVKGLLTLMTHGQQVSQPLATDAATSQALPGRAPNLSELETLLHSKEGSRTLEILAQDLTTTRTLSAGELMAIPAEEVTAASAQAAAASGNAASAEAASAKADAALAGPVISSVTPQQRNRSGGAMQVTSGACD